MSLTFVRQNALEGALLAYTDSHTTHAAIRGRSSSKSKGHTDVSFQALSEWEVKCQARAIPIPCMHAVKAFYTSFSSAACKNGSCLSLWVHSLDICCSERQLWWLLTALRSEGLRAGWRSSFRSRISGRRVRCLTFIAACKMCLYSSWIMPFPSFCA